jgi:DNA-directed RNA polymerase beta' subunit
MVLAKACERAQKTESERNEKHSERYVFILHAATHTRAHAHTHARRYEKMAMVFPQLMQMQMHMHAGSFMQVSQMQLARA